MSKVYYDINLLNLMVNAPLTINFIATFYQFKFLYSPERSHHTIFILSDDDNEFTVWTCLFANGTIHLNPIKNHNYISLSNMFGLNFANKSKDTGDKRVGKKKKFFSSSPTFTWQTSSHFTRHESNSIDE